MLDLLLEDIGKLDWAKPTIDEGRAAVKFIKGNGKPRELYRELGGKALLLPGQSYTKYTVHPRQPSVLASPLTMALNILDQILYSKVWH